MSDIAVKIGTKAGAAALDKLMEITAAPVLSAVLGPFAGPALAAALGAATKVAIETMYEATNEATNELGKQLDTLLSEPFITAKTTVQEVLSVRITNEVELTECDRQLSVAFDGLRRARIYAADSKPELLATVLLYQAVVIALKRGGKPFAEAYVARLRQVADGFSAEGLEAETEAIRRRRASDAIDPERHFAYPRYRTFGDELDYYAHLGEDEQALARRDEERKASLLNTAEQSERQARKLANVSNDLMDFCRFVLEIAANREAILMAARI